MKKILSLILLILFLQAPALASSGSYRVDGRSLVLTSDWSLTEALNTRAAVPQGLTGDTLPGFNEIDTIDLNGFDIVLAASLSALNPAGSAYSEQINPHPGIVLQQDMTLTNGSGEASTISVKSGGFGPTSTSGAIVAVGKVNVTISNLTVDASGATGRRLGDGPVQATAMGLEVAQGATASVRNCNVYGLPAVAVAGSYPDAEGTNSESSASLSANGCSFESRLNTTSAFASQEIFEGALMSFSVDSGTPTAVLNDTSVLGNNDLGTSGICLEAPNSSFRLSGTTDVEGDSGVVLRGGSLSVTDKTQIAGTGKATESGGGAGIAITPLSPVELVVGGTPTVSSDAASAVVQSSGEEDTSLLKRVQITGGRFISPSGVKAVDFTAPSATGSIQSGVFSHLVDLSYLDESVSYAAKAGNDFIYGPSVSSLTTSALTYDLTITETLPLSSENAAGLPQAPDESNKVISLSFDPGQLSFFGPATDESASQQSLPLNLNLQQFGSDPFMAWNLQWEIRSVNVPTNVNQAELSQPLDWMNAFSGTQSGYPSFSAYDFATRFSQTGWALAQDTTTNAQGITSVNQTYLISDGTYTSPGTYELIVTVPGQYSSNGREMTDSIVFTVNTTSVKNVVITDYNTQTPAKTTVTYNMSTNPGVQYSYLATSFNGTPTPGANGRWNLSITEGNVSDYAQIDPESGRIAFEKTTSPGQYLVLTVSVEGTVSPPVYISVEDVTLSLSVSELRFTAPEQSETVTAAFSSPNFNAPLTWKIEPASVATVEAKGAEAVITAVSDGLATLTVSSGVLSATATVNVTTLPVIGDISVSAVTPDAFTVSVSNLSLQPSFGSGDPKVSVFAWSETDQSDINAKVVADTGSGIYKQDFPVNNTPDHEHFMKADKIYVNVYVSSNEASYMIGSQTVSWVAPDAMGGHNCAYIGYSQEIGFDLPTVFDGEMSGTEGRVLGLEGLRISSGIEGVQVVSNVHVENIGWINDVEDGTYAGTMGKNLQIEAIDLKLTGPNAPNYQISYKVHGQNYGWTDWTTGGIAGTTGQNLQLEALQVQITKIN